MESELLFDERIKDTVDGLIWLGHLEGSFEFCGHHFLMRTLKADEELAASLVAKEYAETIGQGKAWAWANVALALVAIDGDSEFCPPIGPDKLAYAKARFQYVTSRWYWPTGQYLFKAYEQLYERQRAAIEAIQGK